LLLRHRYDLGVNLFGPNATWKQANAMADRVNATGHCIRPILDRMNATVRDMSSPRRSHESDRGWDRSDHESNECACGWQVSSGKTGLRRHRAGARRRRVFAAAARNAFGSQET
jgi:hypothetical protein